MTKDFYDGDENDRETRAFVDDDDPLRGVRPRLWIGAILLAFILLLFIADRYVTLVRPGLEDLQNKRDLQSVESLENDVQKVLDSYGVQNDWITKKTVTLADGNRIRDQWFIKVPHNLPLASVNFDLKETVDLYSGQAFAVEDGRKARIAIHIKFRGLVRYSLVLAPTTEVRRLAGEIAILVDGIFDAPDAELEEFMMGNDDVACILNPVKDNIPLYSRLRRADKEVILHFHFKPVSENESKFELAEDLSEQTLRSHLRYIVKNYPAANLYYITSERALGSTASFVEQELEALELKIIESATLSYIDRNSREEVMSARMNDLAAVAVRDGKALGVVELRDGILRFLRVEMKRLRKKGFSFVSVARYLRS